mgnify:CR=1 FL=1|tara:strand:+ start:1126 stop:1335 length:210 start_codon:yes stop_codon:yes gene_type:complete
MKLTIKGHKINLKDADVATLERVKQCLAYLSVKKTDIRIKLIKFVIQLLDRKIERLYEKKKAKLEQSEI